MFAQRSARRKVTTPAQIANVFAFVAWYGASGMSGAHLCVAGGTTS
jgi:hypothetical protein